MKIPDLRTAPGPDLRPAMEISMGDVVRAAAHCGRAFPVFFFSGQDSPPTRFVVVDGDRHFDALPCPCGLQPRIIYSTDRNGGLVDDGMAWLAISCDKEECRTAYGSITIFTHNKMFNRARGAMGSLARSWWNAMRDAAGHKDDHGNHGGILVTWEGFQKYLQGDTPPETAQQAPDGATEEAK